MTLRRSGALTLVTLATLAACSTGKPLDTSGPLPGSGGVGGSSTGGTTAAASGSGGSAATGTGGSAASGSGGSATGGSAGSGALGGTGGTGALAGSGTGATGGSVGATGGMGGVSAVGGSAGSAATSGSAGDTTMSMGGKDPGVCQELMVVSTPQVPTVELLVDTSSSMWETMPPAWPLLNSALMDKTSGVVQALQSKMRFGFASYKGFKGTSETDAACATMTTVPPALDNHDAIDTVYTAVGATYGADPNNKPKWETPTNYGITYATNILTQYMPDPPGKKYILLVTDGNPNTCTVTDPQCGQDRAIKAAQDAFTAGIGLFVLGLGDIVAQPNNGCPAAARCGLLHLQDLANAGVGAPVHPAPTCDDPLSSGCELKNEACNAGSLLASYTPDAPDVGKPFAVDTSGANATAALVTALSALLADAVSCTVDMDAIVTGDPTLGVVTLGGSPETFNDANGWVLEANKYSVTLQGTACTTFKAGSELSIRFPCDPSGTPTAVHR